jgi:serine/threonine-protein kinase
MLTGRLPFTGHGCDLVYQIARETPPPPSQHRPDLDSRLEAIVMRAMARRLQDRFADAKQLAQALADWRRSTSVLAGGS